MRIEKQQVIEFLMARSEQTALHQADEDLPDQVDTEEHADLLARLGIDPAELAAGVRGESSDGGGTGDLLDR